MSTLSSRNCGVLWMYVSLNVVFLGVVQSVRPGTEHRNSKDADFDDETLTDIILDEQVLPSQFGTQTLM